MSVQPLIRSATESDRLISRKPKLDILDDDRQGDAFIAMIDHDIGCTHESRSKSDQMTIKMHNACSRQRISHELIIIIYCFDSNILLRY